MAKNIRKERATKINSITTITKNLKRINNNKPQNKQNVKKK